MPRDGTALSPGELPGSPVMRVMMVMGKAQMQVPHPESENREKPPQRVAALGPTWADCSLNVVGMKGKSNQKLRGFGRDTGSHVLALLLTPWEMVSVRTAGG